VNYGFFALSLILYFGQQLFLRDFGATRINHGLNKVRFPAPVPVGSSLRAKATILDLRDVPAGVAVTIRYLLEIDASQTRMCRRDARRGVLTQQPTPPQRQLSDGPPKSTRRPVPQSMLDPPSRRGG
jgi:hypothetical protein